MLDPNLQGPQLSLSRRRCLASPRHYLIHDGPDNPQTQRYANAGCIEICGGPNGFVAFNDHIIALSGSNKSTTAQKLAYVGASGCMTITYLPATPPPVRER